MKHENPVLSNGLIKVQLPSESILTQIRKLVSAIRHPRFEIRVPTSDIKHLAGAWFLFFPFSC